MKTLLIIFLLLVASPLNAATYWVSKSGSDSNGCTNSASPLTTTAKLTIAGGMTCVASGDTLNIRTGTYVERLQITSSKSGGGSYATATTIQAYNGEVVTINKEDTNAVQVLTGTSYVILKDLIILGRLTFGGIIEAIYLDDNTNHIKFDNVDASGGTIVVQIASTSTHNWFTKGRYHDTADAAFQFSPGYPFYINSSDNIIEYTKIYNGRGYGIHIYSGFGNSPSRNVIRHNEIYNNCLGGSTIPDVSSEAGILVYSGAVDTVIFRNIVRDSNCHGIQLGGGASRSVIYNNTIVDNAQAGLDAQGLSGNFSTTYIKNNIFSNNSGGDFYNPNSATFGSSNNRCNSAGAGCSTTASPGFANSAGNDFTLTSTSAMINAGTSSIGNCPAPLTCTYTVAYNGTAPDIGAFETFAHNNSEIGAVAANKIVINTQSAYAPVLATSGCTGWSARIDSVAETLTSCTATGNAQVTLQTTNNATAGQTIDWTYNAATGTFTDSMLIGNSLNQEFFSVGPVTATNNVSGAPTNVWTVRHYRCRDWAKSPTLNTAQDWLAAEDANCTVRNDGGRIAIANVIDCTVADCPTAGWEYWFNYDGGAYAAVTNSCATNQLCYDNTQQAATHGAQITAARLTTPQSTFVTGGVIAQASSFPNIDLSQNSSTEVQGMFATQAGVTVGKVICVQPRRDGGTAITYGATSCFTTAYPGASIP
jgi:parallel beta-helix repeat protein